MQLLDATSQGPSAQAIIDQTAREAESHCQDLLHRYVVIISPLGTAALSLLVQLCKFCQGLRPPHEFQLSTLGPLSN